MAAFESLTQLTVDFIPIFEFRPVGSFTQSRSGRTRGSECNNDGSGYPLSVGSLAENKMARNARCLILHGSGRPAFSMWWTGRKPCWQWSYGAEGFPHGDCGTVASRVN